jgi:hypothetical protein
MVEVVAVNEQDKTFLGGRHSKGPSLLKPRGASLPEKRYHPYKGTKLYVKVNRLFRDEDRKRPDFRLLYQTTQQANPISFEEHQ